MSVSKLLRLAQAIADKANEDLHKQWIALSFKFAIVAGPAHTPTIQRIGRLDLVLRQMEADMLDQLRLPDDQQDIFAFDRLSDQSEVWIIRAYEVIRAATQQLRVNQKESASIAALKKSLALVRMPIAKGEIQGRLNGDPLILSHRDGTDPKPYAADGTYIMPQGICTATGSISWSAVDLSGRRNVMIRRQALADEMLNLAIE